MSNALIFLAVIVGGALTCMTFALITAEIMYKLEDKDKK